MRCKEGDENSNDHTDGDKNEVTVISKWLQTDEEVTAMEGNERVTETQHHKITL